MEDEELEEESQEEKEAEAFDNLRYDYKKAREAKTIIDNLITEWSDLYDGKKLGNENPQKSQIVMKEVAKQIEWQKPALMEPFTSTSNPIRIKITPTAFLAFGLLWIYSLVVLSKSVNI